jgi:hypothetical protein
VNERLPIEVGALAAALGLRRSGGAIIGPKAPGAIRAELERAAFLIAVQTQIGTRARNIEYRASGACISRAFATISTTVSSRRLGDWRF